MRKPFKRTTAVVVDYDGTLAREGRVDSPTVRTLEAWKTPGRRLILNTGRELRDLHTIFPQAKLFDCIIAENGALFELPERDELRIMAPPPAPDFIEKLRRSGVQPLSTGYAITATSARHEKIVDAIIRQLKLDLKTTMNRDALMVLPTGIDKAFGLHAALQHFGIENEQVAGIGDAENDVPFLKMCGLSVAVANALPEVKAIADWITKEESSAGVTEALQRLMAKPVIA